MKVVTFGRSILSGVIFCEIGGTVAFAKKAGPQPKEGETWEVIPHRNGDDGTYFLLELLKKIEEGPKSPSVEEILGTINFDGNGPGPEGPPELPEDFDAGGVIEPSDRPWDGGVHRRLPI